MTRMPKNATSASSGTTTQLGAQEVEEQRGDDVADRAAAVAQRRRVAVDRLRVAGRHVDDAEQPEGERRPADGLASGRALLYRVAHDPPAGPDQGQRHQPADLADGADHGGTEELHDPAGHAEPDGGAHDHGGADEEQPGAVAAVLGLEVAGAASEAAGTGADGVRHREPDGHDAPEQGLEGAGDRPGPGADRARRGTSARRGARGALAGGLLPGAPGSGARPAPSLAATAPAGALLGRAAAGRRRARAPRPRRGRRTGRHATNLGDRHTSHMDHTMRVGVISRMARSGHTKHRRN